MPRIIAVAALLIAGIGVAAPVVAGHGVLEGASPPANASLRTAPRELLLSFSEAVDPTFVSVTVVDRDGRRVSGSARVSPDGLRMTVALQPLPTGVYTVRWRVLSAVDGHTTSGFYAFAIGVGAPGGASAGGESPPPLQVAVRWVSYAAALLLAGAAIFAYVILRPALHAAEPHLALSVDDVATSAVARLSLPSALILIGSLVAGLLLQAGQLFETPFRTTIVNGQILSLLTGSRLGWSVLLQSAMAAVLVIPPTRRGRVFRMAAVMWTGVVGGVALITTGQHFLHVAALLLVGTVYGLISVIAAIILPLIPDLQLPRAAWAAPAAAGILLVGVTMNAHASGQGWPAMGADWIHLAGAATWIGGLAALLLTLRTTPPALRSSTAQVLIPRFSTAAGLSLLALIVTGTYSAWLNIPAWSGFVSTPYGRTLLVKLLLVLPWMALGAFNHFVMRPILVRGAGRPLLRRFVRLVGIEVVLAAAVLLAVATLTITPPARVTMPAAAGSRVTFAGIGVGLSVRVSINPAGAGWNAYEVDVARSGRPVDFDGRVELRFVKLDEDIAPSAVTLEPAGAGRFRGQGGELSLPGWWRLDVILRQRGRLDIILEFPLYFDGAAVPAATDAARLLAAAVARAQAVSGWREIQQITDGNGGGVVTRYEFSRPDRMKYVTSSGTEAIVIGTTRYERAGGGWSKDTFAQPITLSGPYLEFFNGAEHAAMGRADFCDSEPCRVVLWEAPSTAARFAGWIGERTHLVHRLLMVAPHHYMTVEAFDFDARIEIRPPK
ncbi:MAG TPA: copper resistance protein CopC [bacterium]|jgi:copper transport protein